MAQELFLGIKLGVLGAGAVSAALGSVKGSMAALGDALRRAQSEQTRLGEAIRQHMGRLAPSTLAALNRDYERLGATIDAVRQRQEKLARAMQRRADLGAERQRLSGEIMGTYATALAVGAPVVGAVRQAAGFGDAVKDIAIVGELTAAEEKRLGDTLRQVARQVNQTAEDMARGVSLLIANGMEAGKAAQQAELLGRFTTATRASFDDAARMMVSFDQLGVSAQDMELAFSQAAKAGKLGSFEVRDMARWFPQLGGYMKAIGITGNKAVVNMASRLQVAMKTAGSTDEAANNFRNFLAKLTSPDTAKDFERLGIDLQGSMLRMARQGLDPIEGAVGIIMHRLGQQSPKVAAELEALSKEIAGIADPAQRAQELERRRAMIEALGSRAGLGQMFQDMQAVGYLLAEIQNRDELKRIRAETASGKNADGQMSLDTDFAKRMESPIEQFKSLKIELQDVAMTVGEVLLPPLLDIVRAVKPAISAFGEWARENPALIKGAIGLALGMATVKAGALSLSWAVNFFIKSPLAALLTGYHAVAGRILAVRAASLAGVTGWRLLAVGMGLGQTAVGRIGAVLTFARAGLMRVGQAVLWLGRAVMLNPIGLVLTAIAAAAYLIWRNWDKIGPMLGRVWNSIKTGFASAWAWLKELPARLLAIGQQIVGGLIDGIKSKLAAAGDAIKDLGQSVVSDLKNLLGIRSPSRVFAELGGFVAEGFAGGIGAGLDGVKRSAAALSAAALIAAPAAAQPPTLHAVTDATRTIRQAVEPVALPAVTDATRTIRQAVEPVALPKLPRQPIDASPSVPAFGATKVGAGGAASMQITFAPNITVTGAASPEAARQQVAQAVQMSFAEFERLMRRYDHEVRRRSAA